jgi:hypothetical protein
VNTGRYGRPLTYRVKTVVAQYPLLALPIARLRRGHGEVVARDTEIVIEGFPRTGSSFAVAAFRRAQGRPVKVAHHVHAPAQLKAAVRWHIPALVLIRRPEDAIVSYLIREPDLPMHLALGSYIRFYRPLLPLRDRLVVATFEQVVNDFGNVIARVNDAYGTRFVPFDHRSETVASVFREIEEDYLTRDPPGERFERIVPRPSERRRQIAEVLRPRYREPALATMRRRAETLYQRFVESPP